MKQETSNGRRRSGSNSPVPRLRIAMYSHDTMGLGHMRRNLLLAQALAGPPVDATILLIAGSNEVNALRIPRRVDCVSLPSLYKSNRGTYTPRRLAVSLTELTRLRSDLIRAAVQSFSPDVLIVDNVPRGANGELNETLLMLADNPRVRCVLGLRDILDEAQAVERQWTAERNFQAVGCFYDNVWVYGDPRVCNPIVEYHWNDAIARKTHMVGYLDPACRLDIDARRGRGIPQCPFVVCTLGGGQDGFRLASAFLRANLPPNHAGIVLTGPCMPDHKLAQLRSLASRSRNQTVLDFFPEADLLIKSAHRVVAMGGYNTMCSVLCHQKSALIVPRQTPRGEQRLRAERFQQLGLVDVLHLEQASGETISTWLSGNMKRPALGQLDFGGLERSAELLNKVLSAPRQVNLMQTERAFAHV